MWLYARVRSWPDCGLTYVCHLLLSFSFKEFAVIDPISVLWTLITGVTFSRKYKISRNYEHYLFLCWFGNLALKDYFWITVIAVSKRFQNWIFFPVWREVRAQSVIINFLLLLRSSVLILPLWRDKYTVCLYYVTCGVPKGSVLEPLRFVLYINDVHFCSEKFNFFLFADDTNILYADKNLKSIELTVNIE